MSNSNKWISVFKKKVQFTAWLQFLNMSYLLNCHTFCTQTWDAGFMRLVHPWALSTCCFGWKSLQTVVGVPFMVVLSGKFIWGGFCDCFRSKNDKIDAKAEYAKRQGDKELINLVVIGMTWCLDYLLLMFWEISLLQFGTPCVCVCVYESAVSCLCFIHMAAKGACACTVSPLTRCPQEFC